jgi:hypothetical protein
MAAEIQYLSTPGISSAGRVTATPFQFTTDGTDNLRVVSFNSCPGVVVNINYRFRNNDGTIGANSFQHIPHTDRSANVQDIALSPGALINLTAFVTGATPATGQTFVIVELIHGLSGATFLLGTLLSDYITSQQPLGWPGSPIRSSLEGEGWLHVVSIANPAAGFEVGAQVPAGARWECLSFLATLGSSATNARRMPLLNVISGGDTVAIFPSHGMQGPSRLFDYTWAPGVSPSAGIAAQSVLSPLPSPNRIFASGTIITSTLGLQVDDRWQLPRLVVREWIET